MLNGSHLLAGEHGAHCSVVFEKAARNDFGVRGLRSSCCTVRNAWRLMLHNPRGVSTFSVFRLDLLKHIHDFTPRTDDLYDLYDLYDQFLLHDLDLPGREYRYNPDL